VAKGSPGPAPTASGVLEVQAAASGISAAVTGVIEY
jgi:hypothetical protein